MCFGIKFLLAMVIFLIASLLSGKTAAAQRMREGAKTWMTLNVALAILVVCISGVLRTAKRTPKPEKPQAAMTQPAMPAELSQSREGEAGPRLRRSAALSDKTSDLVQTLRAI
jgi:hypothetical protein